MRYPGSQHPGLRVLLAAVLGVGSIGLAGCGNGGDPSADGADEVAPAGLDLGDGGATGSADAADDDGGATGDDPAGDEATDGGPGGIGEDEEQIREVHTRFMTELFEIDERVDDPATVLPAAEELTTGNQLERIRQRVRHDAATGEALVGPGYDTNIVEVVIDGDRATVLDCSLDPAARYGPDGAVLVPADDFHKLRSTELVLVDGRWLVENFNTGGDERCDPDEQPAG